MRYRGTRRCPPEVYQLSDLFTEAFVLLDISIDSCFPPIDIVLRLDVFTVCLGFPLVIIVEYIINMPTHAFVAS